ncbi:glycosyltransferase family 4 protein [Candidatus Saccharibacteria bacterium]|nr:glycosyltransferase family 4 protein [Candidatus Saccharibacteria bacterium]
MSKPTPKILLYTEFEKTLKVSGLGKSIDHQKQALKDNQIPFTLNPKDDFDIIHINFYGPKSYLAAKRAKHRGKKVVYHAHSTEEDFKNSFWFANLISPLFKRWIIKCYKLGDVIITPSEYSKKLLESYGLKNIYAISNGIDLDLFSRDESAGKKFRKKYHFSEKDKVVMGIGLFFERKGILDFIELAKTFPEYKFIWFGNINKSLIPHKIRKALNVKLPNLIFPGHVPQPEIKAALSGADLYIFPTFEETEGIPALEALACKTPMILRDIPVFDFLKNKKEVYKAKNLAEFKTLTKNILEKELPDLTKAGYKKAEEKSVRSVGKQLIEIYKTL